jgi:hypothetical protein
VVRDDLPPARRPQRGRLKAVLDREGDAVERPPALALRDCLVCLARALPRGVGVERDDGIELRVQSLDAREVVVEQLDAADLALADRVRERGRGAKGDVPPDSLARIERRGQRHEWRQAHQNRPGAGAIALGGDATAPVDSTRITARRLARIP